MLKESSDRIMTMGDAFPRTLLPAQYRQLPRLDRAHAASLARSCRLSANAGHGSRELANRALLQSLLTSLPLLVADFVTLWLLLFGVATVIERLFSLPHNLVTRETAL